MSISITPIKVYRITVQTEKGRASKRCSQPAKAAEFVAHKYWIVDWYSTVNSMPNRAQRIDWCRARSAKRHRRYLKIFEANW